MREPVPGDILTADKIEAHFGKFAAVPDHKLVCIFLGTCPSNTIPRVMPMLRELGWTRTDFYEVALDIVEVSIPQRMVSRRTFFQCDDPLEARESAARFAHRVLKDQQEREPEVPWALRALLLNIIRLSDIAEDGHSTNVRGDILLHWKDTHGKTIEQMIEELRPADGSQEPH